MSFNYTGHGINGVEAYGRINHDRSFDAHISVLYEGKYVPAISFGLRDFIGTGWYSSEYIVGTKSVGSLDLTAGLDMVTRWKKLFSNPLSALSPRFDQRDAISFGLGGTIGSVNWFQGDTSAFYGAQYHINGKVTLSSEYTPDLMLLEKFIFGFEKPMELWDILSAQPLY